MNNIDGSALNKLIIVRCSVLVFKFCRFLGKKCIGGGFIWDTYLGGDLSMGGI